MSSTVVTGFDEYTSVCVVVSQHTGISDARSMTNDVLLGSSMLPKLTQPEATTAWDAIPMPHSIRLQSVQYDMNGILMGSGRR